MRIRIVLLATLLLAFSSIALAQSKIKATAPNVIVQNLYAAQKAGSSPFFQTKSRALVDKYFTKNFADLIWKDAVKAKGEVGAFDFDPLYNAQDTKITAFKIGKPMYGEGNLDGADVQVTFRNMGKDETVLFQLERNRQKIWKISDIHYPSNLESRSSLKDILAGALKAAEGNAAHEPNTTSDIRSVDFLNYSYQGSVCSEDAGLPKTVKVRNGKFKDRDSNFFDVAKEGIVYGDVNGDGSEEAVVLIRCGSAAGTLRAFEVHAYSFQNGQAKLLARLDSTGVESDYQKSYADGTVFYAGENGPKIVNGHVIVEALTDGSFAGPENVATFDYKLSGNKFVLSGKPTKTNKSAHALLSSKTETIEQLAKAVAEAWSEGRLGSLDAGRPYVGSVKVVVDVQAGEPPMIERKTFRTLAQVDRWFKKRERGDGPGRNIGQLQQCSKGVCTFEQTGMLHNNLYLKKITYGMRKGQPYIKAIYVDDGA